MRNLINGSFEPVWLSNARDDADAFKSEMMRDLSRRKFLAGAGVATLLSYLEAQRAIALPFLHTGPSSVSEITNARTGTTYQYLPAALAAMASGDTILLPAGSTYRHSGTTYYYRDYHNWTSELKLGATAPYGGITGGDYGTLQGVGSANNGRAAITPTYGILAVDYVSGATTMVLDPSTPVANFNPAGSSNLVFNNATNGSAYAWWSMAYTGIDIPSNSLTGVSGTSTGTIPSGTIVSIMPPGFKGVFTVAGQNPGWTFNNLEIAYGNGNGSTAEVTPIFQYDCQPNQAYIGSITLNNCYLHDCRQGVGLGYSGIGNVTMPTFAHLYDTEITQLGDNSGQTHNTYFGRLGEVIMDNCYTHKTAGTWLVKSRAQLNILSYCQIRGERTDANTGNIDNSGCDFSDGGLVYLIGCIGQQSLHAGNQLVNFAAENASFNEGSINPLQEIYAVNNTFVGPTSGAFFAPIQVYYNRVQFPCVMTMSQASGGSLAAREYWALGTSTGATSGETRQGAFFDFFGVDRCYSVLDVSANNLATVNSPPQITGAGGWNCYANYGDPVLYGVMNYPQDLTGNNFYWDSGHTQPVFSSTSGGTTISCTGTLSNGSSTITGATGLSGLGSLAQLIGMTVFVGGTSTGRAVTGVDTATGNLTLNGTYSGSNATSFTFGWYFWVGITYQTSLGDSYLAALNNDTNILYSPTGWFDATLTSQSRQLITTAVVQVVPGTRLIVNAPPSGPAWATGVNVWFASIPFATDWATGPLLPNDAGLLGFSKQNSSAVAFGGSWTSPAGVFIKGQKLTQNLFLQNTSPLSVGANFTEPTSGLANHNANTGKLQWMRRGSISNNGFTMDCWYAVVPAGGLSGYTETVYLCGPAPGSGGVTIFNSSSGACKGSVSIWRGCAADPFDANFPVPACNSVNSTTISTAAGNVVALAAIRGTGTAGSGFTQLSTASGYMNAAYKASVSALSGQMVTETGGSGGIMIADVLAGSGSPPSLVGSPIAINGTGPSFTFSVASANAGDVLYMTVGQDSIACVAGAGDTVGPPPAGNAVGASPIVNIRNCISVNYNGGYVSGDMAIDADTGGRVPAANLTQTTNLACNIWNGSSFTAPLFATVFADATQADYDYRLASGSPSLNAASNPGTVHGQDLIPHYQSSWHGTPTPGTPVPAKTTRSDVGPSLTGSIGALS